MKSKDKKFVSLLYDNYSDALFGIVLRIVINEEAAKDVMQDSFIKVWKNVEYFNPKKAKLFTWLLQIFRNTAIDHLRKIKKTEDRNIQSDHTIVNMESNLKIVPELLDIRENLAAIESKYRKIIEAVYLIGMTQIEVSDHLEIPLGTVKSRLRLGLQSLRKIYGSILIIISFCSFI